MGDEWTSAPMSIYSSRIPASRVDNNCRMKGCGRYACGPFFISQRLFGGVCSDGSGFFAAVPE